MKDLVSNVTVVQSIAPASNGAGAINGTAVPVTGANSVAVVFAFGALGGSGTATVKVQESADGSTNFTDIGSDRLIGTLGAAEANKIQTVGISDVTGLTKAYIRPVITVAGGQAAVLCSALVVKGNLTVVPSGDDGSIYIA